MSYQDPHFDAQGADSPLASSEPLPSRFTRGTLLGCVGILCVLALPLLLFLPLDTWRVPGWLAILAPLAGICALALGAALLMRVPLGNSPARNPFAPTTAGGMPPLVERPASTANRLGAVVTVIVSLVVVAAVIVIASGAFQHHGLLPALLTIGLGGCVLILYGGLIGAKRLPPPALRWVRQPVRGQMRQAAPLALAGLAALTWMLLVAADAGYRWGFVGLGLLVIGGVLAAPLARRDR
ncbi:MAG TPA: hypothetical protein VF120_13250 [Ktedonobacterales bacterium]